MASPEPPAKRPRHGVDTASPLSKNCENKEGLSELARSASPRALSFENFGNVAGDELPCVFNLDDLELNQTAIDTDGYVHVPNFLSPADHEILVGAIRECPNASPEDNKEAENVFHPSKRNGDGTKNAFLNKPCAKEVVKKLVEKLERQVGVYADVEKHFEGLLTVFKYSVGAINETHMDRKTLDRGYGKEIEFTAMVMLSQRGEDYAGGAFYVNNQFGRASEDGKTIFGEKKEARKRFDLNPGDLVLFDNRRVVHGAERVVAPEGKTAAETKRITISIRSTMRRRGMLVAVEGPDKTGKTGLVYRLADHLRKQSHEVVAFRSPDRDSEQTGADIKRVLRDEKAYDSCGAWEYADLFIDNRAEQHAEVEKALWQGKTVIFDRYAYSGIVYATHKARKEGPAGADEIAEAKLQRYCRDKEKNLYRPDLLIVYTADKSGELVEGRLDRDEVWEKRETQNELAKIFKEVIEWEKKMDKRPGNTTPMQIIEADARKTADQVFNDARKVVDEGVNKFRSIRDMPRIWDAKMLLEDSA